MYILNEHGGRLPLKIKAIPEGTTIPYKNGESKTDVERHEICTCSTSKRVSPKKSTIFPRFSSSDGFLSYFHDL
jgi:hypothetical protein